MLPPEILIEICSTLDLRDLVSLAQSSPLFDIPESVYRHQVLLHCPSFTPETTPRSSWKECAHVHVARMDNPNWMDDPYLFDLRGKVETIEVKRDEKLPDNFVSFLDGYEIDDRKYLSRNVIQIGHFSIGEWYFHLGDPHSTPLKTSTGVEMVCAVEDERVQTTVMSDSVIALTSNKKRRDSEDEIWDTYMAFKLDTPGVEPDVEVTLDETTELRHSYKWAFPFVNKNDVHVFYTKSVRSSCRYYVSFNKVTKEGLKQLNEHEILNFEDHGLYWYDGVILAPNYFPYVDVEMHWCSINVHFYDCKTGGKYFGRREIYDIRGAKMSKDMRYVVFSDKNAFVSRIWDLKTNTQHWIPIPQRRMLTAVGTVNGELQVFQFGKKFAKKNVSGLGPDDHLNFGIYSSSFLHPLTWLYYTCWGYGKHNMFDYFDPLYEEYVRRRIFQVFLLSLLGVFIVAIAKNLPEDVS